jgi:glycine/D-amino acid oxidase-like deaminating enzyme
MTGPPPADALVVGGDIAGFMVALELARHGCRVIVASGPSPGESQERPGFIAVGLPSPYIEAIDRHGRDGARAVWETHRENRDRLVALVAELGSAAGPVWNASKGAFALATGREEALALAESEDLLRDDGFSGEFLDHYMLEARFDVRGFGGGYWGADHAAIDRARLRHALAAAAVARGVRIVTRAHWPSIVADSSGVAADLEGGRIAARTAVLVGAASLPYLDGRLTATSLQSLSIAMDASHAVPDPAFADRGRVFWRRDSEHRLRIASGGGPDEVLAFVRAHFPGARGEAMDLATETTYASPDGLPLIGPIPGRPLFVVAGLGSAGHRYEMMAARWAARYVLGGDDETPALYALSRALPNGLG